MSMIIQRSSFLLLTGLLLISVSVSAQQDKNSVAPNLVREADVYFSKRLWRVIDLREKINYKAIWPKSAINRILYEAASNGDLRAYRTASLKSFYSPAEFLSIGADTEFVKVLIDPNDEELYRLDTVVETMNPERRISHLMLMEEWYFDRKLSTHIPRIIAIGLLYNARFAGQNIGLQPVCWFKFYDRHKKEKDAKAILVQRYVFNKENIHDKFTFDDWFEQRRFHSYIIKESNQFDRSLMDDPEVRQNGIDALIRAEIIKQRELERDASGFED